MNKILKILVFLIAFGCAAAAYAQHSLGNIGIGLDPRTLSVQAKAEESFSKAQELFKDEQYQRADEEYLRAHVIYRNDLAPIGDKYAQYMLGFMSLSGRGVEQDPVVASAWYRLAAERGEPREFVDVRDDLLGQLDAEDRARSDEIYTGLRRDYSDIAISMREVRDAFEYLAQVTTGSHLGTPSSAVTIVEPRAGNTLSADALIYRVRSRMQGYLDYITTTLGIDEIEAETVNAHKLSDLEAQVRDYNQQSGSR